MYENFNDRIALGEAKQFILPELCRMLMEWNVHWIAVTEQSLDGAFVLRYPGSYVFFKRVVWNLKEMRRTLGFKQMVE